MFTPFRDSNEFCPTRKSEPKACLFMVVYRVSWGTQEKTAGRRAKTRQNTTLGYENSNNWLLSVEERRFLPPRAKSRGAAPPTGNTHPQCTEHIKNKYKITLKHWNTSAKIPNFRPSNAASSKVPLGPVRLECKVLQKRRYINPLPLLFYLFYLSGRPPSLVPTFPLPLIIIISIIKRIRRIRVQVQCRWRSQQWRWHSQWWATCSSPLSRRWTRCVAWIRLLLLRWIHLSLCQT